MAFKKFYSRLLLRTIGLSVTIFATCYFFLKQQTLYAFFFIFLSVYLLYHVYKYVIVFFQQVEDFFQSLQYKDYTRHYGVNNSNYELNALHKRFNEVNNTIKSLNTERESQNIYLTKILEMIHSGIMAYNIKTGDIIWINESLTRMLNIPFIKNISFLSKRRNVFFETINTFTSNHDEQTIDIEFNGSKQKMLLTSTLFQATDHTFKLIVLQNIDSAHNQIESDAWKKLLSVMTHEIMNSIAPIASLTETLQSQLKGNDEDSFAIDKDDLHAGLETIHRRSEGLLKFALTYRTLSKVTEIHVMPTPVATLFSNITTLMHAVFLQKNVSFDAAIDPLDLSINIDSYLIEQVMINLLHNALDAVENTANPSVKIRAEKNTEGQTMIKIMDNGHGIPEEILENIFVPFFTTKKNGSGIGLSLSKQIMLLHKGKIQINSGLDKGTVVILTFLY